MAKKVTRPQKRYNLYTRCTEGREPKTWASVEVYDDEDHPIGSETVAVPKYGTSRGALIGTWNTYKALTQRAIEIAVYMGIPKSRIWDILDWNQD